VLATLAAYLPALGAGYVWDDDYYVTRNPLLWEPDGLRRIWLTADAPSQYFPLVYTMFRLEYALWGLEPFGYHLVNVLLHAANALLFWRVLAALSLPGGLFAAALFALHPVHVESVAWITERKNTLSLLFFLASLYAWVRYTDAGGARRYAASLAFYQLALFAKTTACVLPAALVLSLWVRGKPVTARRWLAIVPYLALGLLMGTVTLLWERYHQGTVGERFAIGWPEVLLVASRSVWFYLGKLLLPRDLTFSYPKFHVDPGEPWHWVPLLAGVLLLATLFALRRRTGRGPLAAALFFVAALSPILGFIPLYTFVYAYVADHYQYIASLAPIALVAAAAARLAEARRELVGVGLAVLLVLGVATFRQAGIYESRETLWRDTIAKHPESWMGHHELGTDLFLHGRVAESIPSFERALAIRPDLELTHRNLGLALWSQGRLSEARRHLEEAVRLRPDYYDGHASLAGFLIAAGQPAEARAHGERLVALSPREPAGHVLLAAALAAEGRRSEAEARYREAVAVDGGNVPALLGLAESLATCPRDGAVGEEALSLAERARLTPGTDESARFWAVLARAQAAAGRSVEARRSARRAAAIARRQGNAALVRSLTQPRAFWLHGAPYCSDPPGTPAP
jgi:Flp pilus assembly protein TadD